MAAYAGASNHLNQLVPHQTHWSTLRPCNVNILKFLIYLLLIIKLAMHNLF